MTVEKLDIFDSMGRRIAATLHRPEGAGTFPTVIIAHGFMTNKEKHRALSEALEKEGIASVRFDFFGHGESDGKFENMTVRKMVENLRLVVKHAGDLYFVGSIGLFGSSMGGMAALLHAAQDSRIRAMVLKAPVSDFRQAVRKELGQVKMADWEKKGWVTMHDADGTSYRMNYSFYRDGEKCDVYRDARGIECPLLVVHGNKDSNVPLEQSKRLLGAVKSEEKELEVLEGCTHYFRPEEKKELIRLSVSWFGRWLK